MTKLTNKAIQTDTEKLNLKKQEILGIISSMRQSLKIARVRKAVDPHGLLLKKINQTENLLPQITLISEARGIKKLVRDCKKPVDRALGTKSQFEKRSMHDNELI
ncbi:MAG: hypothetical protein NTX79_02445 [Candidatus Micrarchaeota archaeon]|nr:hypothetical protein [Candidatus Micrarchaeota archaeon]